MPIGSFPVSQNQKLWCGREGKGSGQKGYGKGVHGKDWARLVAAPHLLIRVLASSSCSARATTVTCNSGISG